MPTQEALNYDRIATAIDHITAHYQEQPGLDELAAKVHLSPFHFQKLFTEWAGVSPKKFLQYITVEHAKGLLRNGRTTLFDAAFHTGLSGAGRLHDLFVGIEGMTPGEYRNGGAALTIHYAFAESRFGNLLVASTTKGICHLAFTDDGSGALQRLEQVFPNATFLQRVDLFQQDALSIFRQDWTSVERVRLHLRATPFQLKVWETLLKVPMGELATYGDLAEHIGSPGAARAVGTAIGDNPVAFLIPCHRVIQRSGKLGGYRWGATRKAALIGWESARTLEA